MRQKKGCPIDRDKLNRLKEINEIVNNNVGQIEEAKDKLNDAQNQLKELKEKGAEFCKKDMLDLFLNELLEEALSNMYLQKKIIRNVLKFRKRK